MICLTNLYSAYILSRHCEERPGGMRTTKLVKVLFKGNERRGNLPSLHNWREIFKTLVKTTSLQPQCKEIASRMWQCIALSTLLFPRRRLAMTSRSNWLGSGQSKPKKDFSNHISCCSKGLQPLVMLAQTLKGGA